MVELAVLHERLLEVALQRSLAGFEQSLRRILSVFDLAAWACVFPPSFQADGHPLFVGHGVDAGRSRMLALASRQGLGPLLADKAAEARVLGTLARELTPDPASRCQVLRIKRERDIGLILFCYRMPSMAEFAPAELEALTRTGRLLDRCYQQLAEQQEQEFMAGLFRLVSNLHPEGLCILDNQFRVVFENRKFREHMHLWNHGPSALQSFTLPRAVELPAEWKEACDNSFQAFRKLTFPPTSGKIVVTQGQVVNLARPLTANERVEGVARYLAFQGSLGVRPYLMLTSVIRQQQSVTGLIPVSRIAEVLKFSRRETQLAELILRGASAREIGARLKIAIPTVKTHIRHILRKAGVKTRLEFVGLCRDPR